MELGTRDALLTLGSGLALLVGVGLILFADALLTVVGILLVTASAVVFIVDATDLVQKTGGHARQ